MNSDKPTIRIVHVKRWGTIHPWDGRMTYSGFVDERCWQCGVLPYGDMYIGKTPEHAYSFWNEEDGYRGDTDRS